MCVRYVYCGGSVFPCATSARPPARYWRTNAAQHILVLHCDTRGSPSSPRTQVAPPRPRPFSYVMSSWVCPHPTAAATAFPWRQRKDGGGGTGDYYVSPANYITNWRDETVPSKTSVTNETCSFHPETISDTLGETYFFFTYIYKDDREDVADRLRPIGTENPIRIPENSDDVKRNSKHTGNVFVECSMSFACDYHTITYASPENYFSARKFTGEYHKGESHTHTHTPG